MRKIAFILFFFIPLMTFAQKYCLNVESPCYSDTATFENDSIRCEFFWNSIINNSLGVTITNKLKSRIYVEWNNVRIDDEPICFETDTRFTYKLKKEDDAIAQGGKTKKIILTYNLFESALFHMFYKRNIKKKGYDERRINLSIKYQTESIDYPIVLRVTKK